MAPVKNLGQIEGLVISSFDVTPMELAMQEREHRLAALNSLADLSQQILAQNNPEGVLQFVAEGARLLTMARVGIARYSYPQGRPDASASSLADGTQLPPDNDWFKGTHQAVYRWLLANQGPMRLSMEELRQHLAWGDLPAQHIPLHGLLAARLAGLDGLTRGLVMVVDKAESEFTAEDEALINQLATFASLRLQHLEARRKAEQCTNELRIIFNALSDAVVVCDLNGVTLSANPAARELCGPEIETLDRAALANKLAFRHEDDRLYAPEDLPVYQALRGETISDQIIVCTNPQGERRVVMTAASPLHNDGRLVGAVTVWHDITEREKTRLLLEEERARLAAIIENAPEGIVVIDEVERVVLTNPAAIRFYGRDVAYNEDLLSQLHLRFFYPNGQLYARAELPLSLAIRNGRVAHNLEMGVTWPDGQQRTLLVNAAPIRDPQQRPNGAIVVFQDITKRRQVDNALKRRVHDLRLLNRLSRDLSATLDQQRVLDGMLEAVHRLVQSTGSCIWLWDQEHQGWLVCEGCIGSEWVHEPLGQRLHPEEGFWAQVLNGGRSLIVNDVSTMPELASYTSDWLGITAGSILGVPLRVGDRVLGALLVASDVVGRFKGYERMLLETLTSAAAAALENARSLADAQRTATTAERSRLARDLHDAVSQSLFSASIIAETLPRLWERDPSQLKPGLEQLQHLARSSLAEMRSLLLELRPSALLETKLADLIKQLAETVGGRSHLVVELDLDNTCTAPPDVHIGLYRITQEALNNVTKHGRASRVLVSLRQRGVGLELLIRDDGRGFDLGREMPGHFGLGIMRERAEALGLDYAITSQPGAGTEIVVHYPRTIGKEPEQ